jgi:hypothetical protein
MVNKSSKTELPVAAGHGVYWWRLPDDEPALMSLSLAEFRCYMVVMRSIQRDQNHGVLSVRQVQKRTGLKSVGNVHAALAALVERGLVLCDSRPGKMAVYRQPFAWRGDANCSAVVEQLKVVSRPVLEQHCSAGVEHNCSAVVEQTLEPLEKKEKEQMNMKTSSSFRPSDQELPADDESLVERWKPSDDDMEFARAAMARLMAPGAVEPFRNQAVQVVELARFGSSLSMEAYFWDLELRSSGSIRGVGFFIHDAPKWLDREDEVLVRYFKRGRRRRDAEAGSRVRAARDLRRRYA